MPSAEAKAVHSSLADRYRVLLDISRTLTGTLSRDDLYRAIYRETARVLEAMKTPEDVIQAADAELYRKKGDRTR